jgi:Cysteine-rich secretory protein family
MQFNKRWLALLLIAALTLMGLGISASADSGTESEFLSKINAERSAVGLAPLKMSGSLSTYARGHSVKMAEAGEIYHSTSAQLTAAAGSGWTKIGENVGRGPSVSSLHTAFMNSSGHKANILGSYDTAGVGVTTSDGYIYVTVVFVNYGGGGSTATTVKSSTTKTTSQPTTTTLPPTTTTTLIVGPDKEVTPGVDCIQANRFWQMCHD